MSDHPYLIYDNLCTSCTEFAKAVNKLVYGKITMLGHYTPEGKQFKQKIFPPDYQGLDMSWFVTENYAYGGRKGLVQLIKHILNPLKKGTYRQNNFDLTQCTTDCKTMKGVMIRSCSILTQGEVIEIA